MTLDFLTRQQVALGRKPFPLDIHADEWTDQYRRGKSQAVMKHSRHPSERRLRVVPAGFVPPCASCRCRIEIMLDLRLQFAFRFIISEIIAGK
ncbi:MAG: hypothetical protein JXQ27_09040 [Acidobacteria bacterium]|nr:hypothetical protein [Acidobacteriota bacterium]